MCKFKGRAASQQPKPRLPRPLLLLEPPFVEEVAGTLVATLAEHFLLAVIISHGLLVCAGLASNHNLSRSKVRQA